MGLHVLSISLHCWPCVDLAQQIDLTQPSVDLSIFTSPLKMTVVCFAKFDGDAPAPLFFLIPSVELHLKFYLLRVYFYVPGKIKPNCSFFW